MLYFYFVYYMLDFFGFLELFLYVFDFLCFFVIGSMFLKVILFS